MPRDFNVGDRELLRNGMVIECVEVYFEGRRKGGKWIEIGHLTDVENRRTS